MRELSIEVSIRVTDGSFESRLSVPVTATKEQLNNLAQAWIGALATAINLTTATDQPESSMR